MPVNGYNCDNLRIVKKKGVARRLLGVFGIRYRLGFGLGFDHSVTTLWTLTEELGVDLIAVITRY